MIHLQLVSGTKIRHSVRVSVTKPAGGGLLSVLALGWNRVRTLRIRVRVRVRVRVRTLRIDSERKSLTGTVRFMSVSSRWRLWRFMRISGRQTLEYGHVRGRVT